jgi:hypothetical protein
MEIIFASDGSMRDIYVLDTDINDWQTLLDYINAIQWEVTFFKDGNKIKYAKANAQELFGMKTQYSIGLSIEYKRVTINCHFFCESEIEFDVYPRQVDTLNIANAVIEFMVGIAELLRKTVILTYENSQDSPMILVTPDNNVNIKI